eukprot:109721-Hanusia_phi.AAC.2
MMSQDRVSIVVEVEIRTSLHSTGEFNPFTRTQTRKTKLSGNNHICVYLLTGHLQAIDPAPPVHPNH